MTIVPKEKININERELKARLGGANIEIADDVIPKVISALNCRYCIRETKVELKDDGCDVGFGFIPSKNLRYTLEGCEDAYVLVATIGHDVDRLLRKAGARSIGEHFIMDAVASSAVEALCDYIQSNLPNETKVRFAPGYGDFDIIFQGKLLDFMEAAKIGVTVNASYQMNPMKTITAIMGIKK